MVLAIVVLITVSFISAFVVEKSTRNDVTAWHVTNIVVAMAFSAFVLLAFFGLAGSFLWSVMFQM